MKHSSIPFQNNRVMKAEDLEASRGQVLDLAPSSPYSAEKAQWKREVKRRELARELKTIQESDKAQKLAKEKHMEDNWKRKREEDRRRHKTRSPSPSRDAEDAAMEVEDYEIERQRLLLKCATAHSEIERLLAEKLKHAESDDAEKVKQLEEKLQEMESKEEEMREAYEKETQRLRSQLGIDHETGMKKMESLSESIHAESLLRLEHAKEVAALRGEVKTLKEVKKEQDTTIAKLKAESVVQMQRVMKQHSGVRDLWEADIARMKSDMVP